MCAHKISIKDMRQSAWIITDVLNNYRYLGKKNATECRKKKSKNTVDLPKGCQGGNIYL